MNNSGPALNFGEKFKNWDTHKQLEYLKKLAASQNEALDQMQKDRDRLAVEMIQLRQQLHNAEEALHIQKNINRAAIAKHNEDAQEAGARIIELQAQLRE